ncbi:MAG: cache domain-containing protein [Thermoanaerobaculaceae bacterium]
MVRNTVLLVLLIAATPLAAAPPDPAATLATSIVREVQQRLVAIVAVAQAAAREAPTRSAEPEAMRAFLVERARYVPHVLHVAFITDKGVVQAIGPGYRFLEGTDLSTREWIKSVLASRKPTVSRAFLSLEGFYAVAVLAPVVRSGRFVGLISVAIRPTALLADWVESARGSQPFDVWVMETGGRLLYDPDPEEVGKNLLEDGLYAPHAELTKLSRAIARARQGGSRFVFTPVAGDAMELHATWRSVTAAGTSWRVVVVGAVGEGRSPLRTLANLGLPSATEALRTLAGDTGFVEALARDERPALQAALGRYYDRYPCYAVQWMTPKGFVVGGYPPGNALVSYQLDPFENRSDTFLLERAQVGKEGIFRAPLAEGLMGVVHVVPVRAGEELVGFVYAVRVD